MSSKHPKTTLSLQTRAQTKSDRHKDSGEHVSMLVTDEQAPVVAGILEAITALKKNDFGRVLTAINGIKSDFKDFSGRLGQAENRISDVEDDIAGEKTKIAALEKRVSELTSKIDDLENRNRRSNLRLVNLPEKVEKGNAAVMYWVD